MAGDDHEKQQETSLGELINRRIEIILKEGLDDPEGQKALRIFHQSGFAEISEIRSLQAYRLQSPLIESKEHLHSLAQDLFVDPVLNDCLAEGFFGDDRDFDWYVEITYKPGVTDNASRVARENLGLLMPDDFSARARVLAARGFFIKGAIDLQSITEATGKLLMNPLIQKGEIISKDRWPDERERLLSIPTPSGDERIEVKEMDCSGVDSIMKLSRERTLALSVSEAQTIHQWFADPQRRKRRKEKGLPENASDIELEALAQTWSEHCKHKIFNAEIHYIDENGKSSKITSLYKSLIQKATRDIQKTLGDRDWCLSVFKDNAGVIRFNEDYSVAFKVETHNSPSALDPYGGALTGIVGVNRDAFGTGMGAELVANTDVFCFGPPDYDQPLPERLFHPKRVFEGVRLGVEHGGNHSGVPTINGSVVFDECFLGKPLVFCGSLSVMPAQHRGQPGEDKLANPGDLAVMVGGRIGKDGIHGATFSSEELGESSPVSAVQIGDPITQKKMFDFLWEAKNQNLYSCITDNGAGGLSSSVGEMAEFTNGCKIDLGQAPLKYEGLQPWEILISEAQERMTVSVSPLKIAEFLALSRLMDVESTVVGEFTDTGLFECFFNGKLVASLEMDFLHDGLPRMRLEAEWKAPAEELDPPELPSKMGETLKSILGRPDICSKEKLIRQYDHEVKGGSVIKPLVGVKRDAPADAGVIRPVLDLMMGLAVSNGICPKYSQIDCYHMAACAIDEAIRNIISVGGSLDQIAGLDNFCWPDPVLSDKTPDGKYKLAQLVRACEAVYDYCVGFGVPLISGKDSMKNDSVLEGKKISILPTLLFSAVGVIKDVRNCVTSDFKAAGDLIYLVGETFDELGASEYYRQLGKSNGAVPKVNLTKAKARYRLMETAIQNKWIRSCHDCSDGGLAVALAESAFGGRLGVRLEIKPALDTSGLREDLFLFSESQSRFVISIAPKDREAFERHFKDDPIFLLGETDDSGQFKIQSGQIDLIDEKIQDLFDAWRSTLG